MSFPTIQALETAIHKAQFKQACLGDPAFTWKHHLPHPESARGRQALRGVRKELRVLASELKSLASEVAA